MPTPSDSTTPALPTPAPQAPALPTPAFESSVARYPGVDVVTARGEIDITTAMRLRDVLVDHVLCAQPALVLDLGPCTFLDSTGIGTLIATRRWTQSRSARMVLVCRPGQVLRVLEMTGLHQVFEVFSCLDEALAALAAGSPTEVTD